MKFLINISPVFERFLKFFQQDAPLVHCLYSEMLSLLLTLLKGFIKANALDGLSAKQLLKLDVTTTDNQLPKVDIDFGLDTEREVRVVLKCFGCSFIRIVLTIFHYDIILKHIIF